MSYVQEKSSSSSIDQDASIAHKVHALEQGMKKVAVALKNQVQIQQASDSASLPQSSYFDLVARCCQPSSYQGQGDPLVLENWIREFDKIFCVIGCPEDKMVAVATYYLRGMADYWWEAEQTSRLAQADFGWQQLKKALRDQFCPCYMKADKYRELSNLKQGSMTLDEYYTKFIDLSRVVRDYIIHETVRVKMFISGLDWSIQEHLVFVTPETLQEAYNNAARIYYVLERRRVENAGQEDDSSEQGED